MATRIIFPSLSFSPPLFVERFSSSALAISTHRRRYRVCVRGRCALDCDARQSLLSNFSVMRFLGERRGITTQRKREGESARKERKKGLFARVACVAVAVPYIKLSAGMCCTGAYDTFGAFISAARRFFPLAHFRRRVTPAKLTAKPPVVFSSIVPIGNFKVSLLSNSFFPPSLHRSESTRSRCARAR